MNEEINGVDLLYTLVIRALTTKQKRNPNQEEYNVFFICKKKDGRNIAIDLIEQYVIVNRDKLVDKFMSEGLKIIDQDIPETNCTKISVSIISKALSELNDKTKKKGL